MSSIVLSRGSVAIQVEDFPYQSIRLSISALHFSPYLFIATITPQDANAIPAKIVKSHPFPIALISGSARKVPKNEKIFLTKLFNATPLLAFLGMNSVSMVVTDAKSSMLPMPKKKLAIMGATHSTPYSTVQPYQSRAAGMSRPASQTFSPMRSSGRNCSLPFASMRPALRAWRCMMRSAHLPPKAEASR